MYNVHVHDIVYIYMYMYMHACTWYKSVTYPQLHPDDYMIYMSLGQQPWSCKSCSDVHVHCTPRSVHFQYCCVTCYCRDAAKGLQQSLVEEQAHSQSLLLQLEAMKARAPTEDNQSTSYTQVVHCVQFVHVHVYIVHVHVHVHVQYVLYTMYVACLCFVLCCIGEPLPL